MIPVLFGISIVTFLMIHLIPGDPATILLGTRATPEMIERLTVRWGLDKPLYEQYMLFLKNLFHGHLGDSVVTQATVNQLIGERIGTTFFLSIYASFISIVITVPVALWSALKKDSMIDNGARIFSITALTMPSFWLAILFMMLFSIKLKWFPVSGYGEGFFGHLHYLFLPAFTIAIGQSSIMINPLRNKLISVLNSEYIEAARARGLTEVRVVVKHVLRNALSVTITLLGVNMGWLLSGSVIVETVYSIPGLGQLLVNSINSRDYAVVQGLVLVFGLLVIVVNFLTDLCYSLLDPRVDLE